MKAAKVAGLLLVAAGGGGGGVICTAAGDAVTFRMTDGTQRVIEVAGKDGVMLRSPAEGLWSVATAWQDGWPADWHHAHPEKVENAGEWTIVSGYLELPQGRLGLRDAYREEEAVVHGIRRFAWEGKTALTNGTLSVRWIVPGAVNVEPLLPGIIYYGPYL